MLNTFRAYDPATIHTKSYSTACEACYSRKVKCELTENGEKCKQCADHGVECKARTRKRKAHPVNSGQQGSNDGILGSSSSHTIGRRQDRTDGQPARKRRTSSLATTTSSQSLVRTTSSLAAPDLFVNRDNRNGLSPESPRQPEIPSQTRNASYLSRSAILGDDFPDIDHSHVEKTDRTEDKLSSTQLKVLRIHEAFDLPDLPVRQSLVEAFIKRCFTWMPVIDLDNLTGAASSLDRSLLLMQSVILVGSLMLPDVCGKGFSERQYQKVKALIHSNHEKDPLNMLAALCLVQWYAPTAPKNISTDTPRLWNTYGIGLAQQIGLQRPVIKDDPRNGLRNRIWWTLVTRDNITASAHGRPRIMQPEDCLAPMPTLSDFGNHQDLQAEIFTYYVSILRILGDLCQVVTRKGEASPEDKQWIGSRLLSFLHGLPDRLRLHDTVGHAQPYSLDLAQLHVPIMIAIIILFRPRTVYQLAAANAGSATAAFLGFRIFQAIQLREHTRFLSSAFSWHLLVTAIPLLSCTKVAALEGKANEALDSIENVLETLGKVRPSAKNNLRNVTLIRKAMTAKQVGSSSTPRPPFEGQDNFSVHLGYQISQAYGLDAVRQYEQTVEVLRVHSSTQAERSAQAAAHTLSCLSGRTDARDIEHGHLTPDTETWMPMAGAEADIQNAFTALFENDTLSNSWMMRDWMDELQM